MKKRNIIALIDAFHLWVQTFLNNKADIILGAEFLLLIILYPIFMFFDTVPILGLVVLGMLWVGRLWITGTERTVTTPMDMPVFGILALLPVSLFASTDWSLSMPKVYGIILGISIFYVVVNAIDTVHRLEFAIIGIILLGISVAFLGLIGADWATPKLFPLPWIYGVLPRLIHGVPRSISGGIQPNIIGGALIFFIPCLVSLLFYRLEFKTITNARLASILRSGSKPILLFSLVLTSITLILTQSRGSLMGVAAGLFALALWRDRRFLWLIPSAAVGLAILIQLWGIGNLTEFFLHLDVAGGITLQGRMELWQRAVYVIQDFPFTGVGIGTFDSVAHVLYPFFLISSNTHVPHAHNMLLEMAVDLGIPGLVLYAALLSGFASSAWKTYQAGPDPLRPLIVGLVCGMLAHQVFGIMDAFMLGTKLGAVMWVFIGLVAAMYIHRDQPRMQVLREAATENVSASGKMFSGEYDSKTGREQARNQLRNFLLSFFYWILISMFAIAFIGDQPYLGLAIALVGGGILGLICISPFESKNSQMLME